MTDLEAQNKNLISQIDPRIINKVITECYKGERYEDIARKYNIPIWLISSIRRKYERENLYGQHTGGGK